MNEKNGQIDVSADIDAIKMTSVSLRIDEHDYDIITEWAKKDARSFNGQVRYMLGKYIELNGGRSALFGDVNKEDEQLF